MRLIHVCVLAACTAVFPTTMVWAQDKSIQFRLEPDAKNPVDCHEQDNAMVRTHTMTIKGDQAEIVSAGGVEHKLTLARPNVYTAETRFGATALRVLADLSVTPPVLTVTDTKRCKWNGRPV